MSRKPKKRGAQPSHRFSDICTHRFRVRLNFSATDTQQSSPSNSPSHEGRILPLQLGSWISVLSSLAVLVETGHPKITLERTEMNPFLCPQRLAAPSAHPLTDIKSRPRKTTVPEASEAGLLRGRRCVSHRPLVRPRSCRSAGRTS